jgi:hypothetical protein
MNRRRGLLALFLIIFVLGAGAQQAFPSAYDFIYGLFDPDPNEGLTVFLSTLIPMGGSAESMGMAYTAVAQDASFLELNPAGSALLERTQIALFHNNWIQDTRIESAIYAVRFGTLGLAAGGKWLYLPFTERDDYGYRVTSGYYSEALAIGNVSLHLFPGYYFYGLSVGANVKLAYRSMPDYGDDLGNVIKGSGASQSALALMTDIGLLTRFNFLKFYSSRTKNFSVGMAVKNIGPTVMDEPLPTVATLGLAYNFFRPILISADISQPINLQDLSQSEKLYWGVGYSMIITDFWSLRAGLLVKGANPRISAGASIAFFPMTLDVNYTLDLTTQFTALNRISIVARFDLGDMGRASRAATVDSLYIGGLEAYAANDLEKAIELWTKALDIDPFFDPAREARTNAVASLELQKRILDLQRLE